MLRHNPVLPPFAALITLLLCGLALAACGLQPVIVDEPKPTATPVTANVPDTGNDSPSKSKPEQGVQATLSPGEFTYANGVPFPVPSTEANPIRSTAMEEAWGAKLDINIIPALIDPEHIFKLRAIDEEGRFIVGDVISASLGDPTNGPADLAIMDLQTGVITTIPRSAREHEANYAYSTVAVNGDWVLWLSNTGIPGDNNIRAYNRATASLLDIDMAAEVMNAIPSVYMAGPAINANSVDHGIVVWAEPSGEIMKGKLTTVIKGYNLETGETIKIGKYGVKPVIAWPYVAWLEPDLSSDVDAEYITTTIVHNLETGETRRLNSYWSVRELAMYDNVIAHVSGVTRFLESIDQTSRQLFTPVGGMEAQKLTINSRLVAWASFYSPAVWDRKLEQIVRLPGVTGLAGSYYDACIVNGHMLAWQSGPSDIDLYQPGAVLPLEDVKIYVLDTQQLP